MATSPETGFGLRRGAVWLQLSHLGSISGCHTRCVRGAADAAVWRGIQARWTDEECHVSVCVRPAKFPRLGALGWGAPPPNRCKIIRHDNRLIAAHIKNSSCL